MSSHESSADRVFFSRPHLVAIFFILPCFVAVGQDTSTRHSADSLLTEARTHLLRKEYTASIPCYEQYLRIHPSDKDVRNELARAFAWDTQYDSALVTYDAVLLVSPTNFDARYGRCQTLVWNQEQRAALLEADTLMIRFPGNIDVLLLAGRLHFWNKDFARSLELNRQVLTEDEENVPALIGACAALQAMGKGNEAYLEVSNFREHVRENGEIEKLFEQLSPPPRNQVYLRVQNEHFNVANRSDFRTIEAQYYRTIRSDLTIFAQADAYRRFDQNDQSLGCGAYYTITHDESLYGYILATPNPKVTSNVDALVEYERVLSQSISAFASYRMLAFRTETAHAISPGFIWNVRPVFELKPRLFIVRTIVGKTTSYAFSAQASYTGSEDVVPYVFYSVGNEAYRGVTLDNVVSAHSWSITVGGKLMLTSRIAVRASYQYLNRIGQLQENSVDVGLGYFW